MLGEEEKANISPKYGPKLTSLQGEELYRGLISFTEKVIEKRTARLYEKRLRLPPCQRINTKHPVYVIENENIERNKLENQTIAELSKFIIDLIDTLPTHFKEIYIYKNSSTVSRERLNLNI
ncbi:unnamed protein product [Owenia fusiformis]|uniref:Uncharacterized protein n=1 Tax=Owenia fusiformis TaxID=6347 RepID=A0A8S4P8C7_OWEFU|nr:unnamed protein product [Owenia fusiformis]